MTQQGRWRWLVAGLIGLVTAAGVFLLARFFLRFDAQKAAQLAGVLGLFVTLGKELVPRLWSVGRWAQQPPAAAVTDAELDELAKELLTQLNNEWQLRRLQDPVPMPVRWINADDELCDHWENIHGTIAPRRPLNLSGQFAGPPGMRDIVEVFEQVPSRRLTVLGVGGAGKSVLALHFARRMLGPIHRNPGGPLPVILSLGSWDPDQPLRDWMADQLASRIAQGLAARISGGRTRAEELIDRGAVLPVLDGLDEMPAALRPQAITALNNSRREGKDPLLLTCRTQEYATAVAAAEDVLTAAAVVQLQPLTLDDLASYLPRTARPSRAGAQTTTKWHPVLDLLRSRLQHQPPDPHARVLLQVLSTPLMAGLCRIAYSDTPADPRELLKPSSTHPHALEEHLLDQLIPAIYPPARKRTTPTTSSRWTHQRAQRWFTTLALHMARQDTPRDLAWWTLAPSRVARATTMSLTIGLTGALTAALAFWPIVGLTHGFVAALVFGLSSGLTRLILGFAFSGPASRPPSVIQFRYGVHQLTAGLNAALTAGLTAAFAVGLIALGLMLGLMLGLQVGLAFGLAAGVAAGLAELVAGLAFNRPASRPPSVIQFRFGVSQLTAGLTVGLSVAFAFGLAAALIVDIMIGLAAGLATGLAAGLAVGLTAAALEMWLQVEPDIATVVEPFILMRAARNSALAQGLAFGLAFGLTAGLSAGFTTGLTGGLAAGLTVGLPAGLATGLGTGWGQFALARILLAARRQLPLRLMAFLEDARKRGILRRAGAVYQFRHSRLQTRLTERARGSETASELKFPRSGAVR